jgi:hypothetical protein
MDNRLLFKLLTWNLHIKLFLQVSLYCFCCLCCSMNNFSFNFAKVLLFVSLNILIFFEEQQTLE